MFEKTLFSAFVIITICTSNAFGQACCSGGVPLSGNLGLTNNEKGTLQIQTTYDYDTLRDLFFENEWLDDQRRIRNTHSFYYSDVT